MNYKKTTMLFLLMFILINAFTLLSQPRDPDPNTGSTLWEKTGYMDGNMVKTIFFNHGEIAYYNTPYSGEWPKGSGHLYVDGIAAFVQAECIDENGDTIHPMSINYREDIDYEEGTGYARGWYPLPGYCAYYQDSPAMSDDPNSWPVSWPDKPADWAGYWNGYFGKGVKNADLETYYVMDDDYDTEWNFYPDSTDTTRRGLGMEVAVRGFQWSHVLAEDCIFWHFAITNEGTYNYEKVVFCAYIDWGIGQCMPDPGGSDDGGKYNTDLDLAIAWTYNNQGDWGGRAGYGGFAYLESPGNPWDDLDNDNDGIIDERRDSDHGYYDFLPCGYYRADGALSERAREIDSLIYRWHWSGDEDGDWNPFTDRNDNGIHDPDEPLNDDLGADGIGPTDEGYIGPDEGEGDGIPTQGEPDFDQTDKDETDQLGLTAFLIDDCHAHPLSDEEVVWPVFSELRPPTEEQLIGVNLVMFFASGTFPLPPGETQRFSVALLFGEDEDDLIRNKKTVQAIYNANYNFSRPPDKPRITSIPGDGKVILSWDKKAEESYDRYLQEEDFEGYRIYRSTEPSFLEARLITDAYGNPTFRKPIAQFDLANGINGPHLIDVYGVKFNLGDDTGLRHTFVDSNVNNGQKYYYAVVSYDRGFIARDSLGNVLFDEDGNPIGISPTECTSTLFIDETDAVVTDVNTAVVVPNAPAAGYSPPKVENGIKREGPGTGDIEVVFINPEAVKDSSLYRIIISDTSLLHLDKSPTYTLIRDTLPDDPFSIPETLATGINLVGPRDETAVFGGLVVQFRNDTGANVIDSLSDWIVNDSKCKLEIGFNPTFTNEFNPIFNLNRHYPADLKLAFYDTIVDRSKALLGSYQRIWTDFTIWNLTGDSLKQPFLFDNKDKDPDKRFSIRYIATYYAGDSIDVDTTSDEIIMLIPDSRSVVNYWTTWQFRLRGSPFSLNPDYMNADTVSIDTTIVYAEPGDIYSLVTTHPFRGEWMDLEGDTLGGDEFEFVVRKGYLDIGLAKDSLKNIAVVPNPYVVAASWEPPNPYAFGRGKRKIDFIHLPQKCTIRIYTLRGNLVKKIEHNSLIREGAESWDLVTKDGMDVSYGLYIYHVEAPGIGEHIGKFAVIK